MKTNYKNLLGLAFLAMFTLTILSFTMPTGIMDDWGMDAKYKSMENPYAGEGDEDRQVVRDEHGEGSGERDDRALDDRVGAQPGAAGRRRGCRPVR